MYDYNFKTKCDEDPVFFIENVLKYKLSRVHKEMLQTVLLNRYVGIEVPVGHAKTTTISIGYALWRLWREPRGFEIALTSSSLEQSMRVLEEVQSLIETNDFLKELIPTDRQDSWNKKSLKTSKGTKYYVKPFNDSARGIHPNIIIYDDILRVGESDLSQQDVRDIFYSVFMPRGQTKRSQHILVGCVNPETIIQTPSGLYRMKELVKRKKYDIKELIDFKRKIITKDGVGTTSKFFINGIDKTKKIILSNGYQIECTHKHPLWVAKKHKWVSKNKIGWVKAKDIELGDFVAINIGENIFGKKTKIDLDFAYFLGLYISEGSTELKGRQNRLTITNKDESVKNFLKEKYFFNCTDGIHSRKNSKELILKMKNYGVKFNLAKNKIVPNRMFREPKEIQIAFLQGLFDGDGYSCQKDRDNKIGLVSISEQLIFDVQQMLLNFGILTSKFNKKSKAHYKKNGCYIKESNGFELQCYGNYSCDFIEQIGFRINYKNKKMLRKEKQSYKEKLFGFNWLRVKKIIDSESETVDFVVPEKESFIANGIVSHNTPASDGDLFDDIEKKAREGKQWKHVHYSAITKVKPFGTYDNPDDWVEALWYERFTLQELKEIRENISPARFAREYLCNPHADGTSMFNMQKLSSGLDETIDFEYAKKKGYTVMGLDIAYSQEVTADWTVITIVTQLDEPFQVKKFDDGRLVGKEFSNGIFVEKIIRQHGVNSQVIKDMYELYDCQKIILDKSTGGVLVANDLRQQGINVDEQAFDPASRNMLLLNLWKIIEQERLILPFKKNGSSEQTIKQLHYELKSMQNAKTRNQSDTFKSIAKHDDMVMSLALAVRDFARKISYSDKMIFSTDINDEENKRFNQNIGKIESKLVKLPGFD